MFQILFDDVQNGAIDISLNVSGTLPVDLGGTNTTEWTEGSLVFVGADGTSLTEDNSNLFWDDTNNRLGLGTTSPTYSLEIVPTNSTINKTVFIKDATPTTGRTSLIIQGGAADTDFSTHLLLQVKEQAGTTRFSVTEQGIVGGRTFYDSAVSIWTTNKGHVSLSTGAFYGLGWTATNDGVAGTLDTGLFRNAAGVVEVNSGSNGSAFGSMVASRFGVGTNSWPSTGTSCVIFGDGTAPATMGSNTAGIYANDVSGTVNMYAINEAGESTRLSFPAPETYIPTNVTTDRSFDANSYTGDEIADVLGTLIGDLQARGILA